MTAPRPPLGLTFRRRLRTPSRPDSPALDTPGQAAGRHRVAAAALPATCAALLAGLLPAGAARAADNGFYLGAGLTQTRIDDVVPSIDFKDDSSYKLIAGFRPLDAFAVEVNYLDLGRDSDTLGPVSVRSDGKAYAAYAVGLLPLPFVDLYAKAGVARWETDVRATGLGTASRDDSGTEFAWGAGVQARLGSLAARLEYERFDVAGTDGAKLLSLGLTWTFL